MGNTFKTGNYVNGIFQDTSNNIGIGGSPSGSYKFEVNGISRFWDGTQGLLVRAYTGGSGFGAIYSTGVTPGAGNFALAASSTATILSGVDNVSMAINSATKLYINNAGNVGIGTSNVAAISTNYGTLNINGSNGGGIICKVNDTSRGYFYSASEGTYIIEAASAPIFMYTGGSERMRIKETGEIVVKQRYLTIATETNNEIGIWVKGIGSYSTGYASIQSFATGVTYDTNLVMQENGGKVLIGTTTGNASVSNLQVKADAGAQAISAIGRASDGISQYMFMNAANNAIYAFMQGTSTGGGRLTMVANSSGGVYLASGATSWTANTSDERKKKNFETTEGLAEVLQIEPVKYHFEWDDDSVPKRMGFKAQNILPLIPEMVMPNGEKMEDGSDVLTITPDYLLPVLVKAIQELNAKVSALENR